MTKTRDSKDYGIDIERIKELSLKFEQIKKSGEIKRYNEESTKKDFILPLFEALGWNVYNKRNKDSSVSAEETISKKRVDYGFRINGIPKFFLEAKSLKEEDIQGNPKYVTQAIDYAWMKSCSWAILTNFETVAVYNADWKSPYFNGNLFFILHPSDFLTDDRFKKLSKDAFQRDELDELASKYGKKQVKNPIDKQLLLDMIKFRETLSKDIVKNNQDKHLTQDDIDESVQRILDRLIFIRNAEDRGLEENQLQSNVRQWYSRGKGHLLKEISRIYADFDKNYNSKLFAHHLCDDLYIENEALQEVIEGLNQSKDETYRYDFSIIESDVLGNIYEQYLGNILKSTPKRAKLEESKTHRKEQGIYYTPSYIVDYIVKNTVGEFIKTHSPEEIKRVRILDPACGSGSFLIRAFKELENYWLHNSDFAQTTLENEEFYSKKVEILKNNIFGVDLDPKAVEIAQLNLLLQISERKQRLPILQNNIKVGDSLIDDSTVSEKAFDWNREFTEIVNNGGFDMIIGNPPYDLLLPSERDGAFSQTLKYLRNAPLYEPSLGGRTNLFRYFVARSLTLLNKGGFLGFIIPLAVINDESSIALRKFILENFQIITLDNFPQKDNPNKRIFYEAKLSTCILIVKNTSPKDNFKVRTFPSNSFQDIHDEYELTGEEIAKFDPTGYSIPMVSNKEWSLLKKLHNVEEYTTFKEVADSYQGEMNITNYKEYFTENPNDLLMLKGVEIGRYKVNRTIRQGKKEWFSKDGFEKIKNNFRRIDHIGQERIVTQQITGVDDSWRLKAVVVKAGTILANSTNYLLAKKYNSMLLCGILNSKLMDWRFRKTSTNNHVNTYEIESLPFPRHIEQSKFETITSLVKELLTVNEKLEMFGSFMTDENARLKEKSLKLDSDLNNLIYDLYGITEEERSLVEGK